MQKGHGSLPRDFLSIMKKIFLTLFFLIFTSLNTFAEGIVSQVVSAPVFANGTLRDMPSGLNIYLQTDNVQGLDFMNPEILGYGVPPGGSIEVEMISGFERVPEVPLDGTSLLLTVGVPQQGLPEKTGGHIVSQGNNKNTFLIKPVGRDGMIPERLESPAKGAAFDQVQQRGIKIIHIGRNFAFMSRGERGVVEVRFKDGGGNVIARGRGAINFLQKPIPQIFPTNVTHDQRNHNWQRLGPGQVVGVAKGTLPMPFLLFDADQGIHNKGIFGVGVLSRKQLDENGYEMPESLLRYDAGLIIKDRNGDGFLDPRVDIILGGISSQAPEGAQGYQVVTPLVNEKPFLSKPTSDFNKRAGVAFGGSILQVVFIAGDRLGNYRLTFTLLEQPGDLESDDGASVTYTVVVE
jgi:hypothetical protein